MIELNLLPPPEKKLLSVDQTRRWISFYGGSGLLLLLGLAALLGFIWFFILIQLKDYTQSLQKIDNSFQGQSIGRQKELIAEFNQYLAKLNQIQGQHTALAPALAEIANLIPAGARLDGLSIDAANQVSLTGFATQRTQVLMLQEALAKSRFFNQLSAPPANLTKPVNINFSFKFNLSQPEPSDD